jgi:hypothetical protein
MNEIKNILFAMLIIITIVSCVIIMASIDICSDIRLINNQINELTSIISEKE